MYKVKPLRVKGVRKHDREIASEAGIAGVLSLALVGPSYELKLHASNDGSSREAILPILYDARLVSMHGDKMLFKGIERAGEPDKAQYLQEWSVMVLPA